MDIGTKLAVLRQMYRIYDDFVKGLKIACEKFCTPCCTCNVAVTTLEGLMIVEHLPNDRLTDRLGKIGTGLSATRFRPKMTTNRLAERCMRGEDFQDDVVDFTGGRCPLLRNDECSIYTVRPFMCRCMVSHQDCRHTGCADVDAFVISVNNLFLQAIEHVDAAGYSGNLSDVLLVLGRQENRKSYRENRLKGPDIDLIPNRAMNVLMIPPEHRDRIAPILRAIRGIQVPKPDDP